MQRKSSPANPELDALLEERVDLQVRLVVLAESAHPDRAEIERVKRKLAEMDRAIKRHWKTPKA